MVKVVNSKEYINEEKRTVVTILFDEMNNRFEGKAVCSVDDDFDIEFGKRLSYLRAKRIMLRAYNKENIRYYEGQKESWKQFCERAEKEISKYENALDKINNTIDDMLTD